MGGFIQTISNYSSWLYAHTINVALLSLLVGREFGYSEKKLLELGIGAFLDDVEKIFVAKSILDKQGTLDEDEKKVMRQHTEFGAKLLNGFQLKELEQGIYKRNTSGKLPEAHVSFLDEIFKANSAILNSLLTLINERLYYNNGGPVQTPLISVIGSSNEYPEEGEGLEALFDRFLIRFEVDYIGEVQSFMSMLKDLPSIPATMTLDGLYELQFFSDMVEIPDEVLETLALIRKEFRDEGMDSFLRSAFQTSVIRH